MHFRETLPRSGITGRLSFAVATPRRQAPPVFRWFSNSIQYGAANALARLLARDLTAAPAGMYLQYINTDPAGWVIPTDFDRYGEEYFWNLTDGDIIRVPLLATPDTTASGDPYVSNVARFMAMTAGEDGMDGLISALPFLRGVSTVVGGALIAMPDADDYHQDLVLTRGYVTTGLLRPPADPQEVLARWEITIG